MSEQKICPRCGESYPLTENYFNRHSRSKSGFDTYCKNCKREIDKNYYQKNKKEIYESHKAYQKSNPDKVKQARKEYREKNKEKISEYKRNYYENNKEEILKKQKYYYNENKEKILKRDKEYQNANKERIKQFQKDWFKANKETIYKKRAERMKSDPTFAMRQRIRWNISNSFRKNGYTKRSQAYKIIGLPYDELIPYLLKTYENNYGEEWDGITPIHLDHIIPLATATTEEECIKLCYYKNLQLLKAQDNWRKNDKLDFII